MDKYGEEVTRKYNLEDVQDDRLGENYIRELGAVFKRALEEYNKSLGRSNWEEVKKLAVLFVVDKIERNICD
jgi:hypothetical protein